MSGPVDDALRPALRRLVDGSGLLLSGYSPLAADLRMSDTRYPPPGWEQRWLVSMEDDRLVGAAIVAWDRRTRDSAAVHVVVAAADRRRGHATRLLDRATGEAAAAGIRALRVKTVRGSEGDRFATAIGATTLSTGWRQHLQLAGADLRALPPIGWGDVGWCGRCPARHLGDLVALKRELDSYRSFTTRRWRDHEVRLRALGYRSWSAGLVDRQRTLVATTDLIVSPRTPGTGYVSGTVVSAAHRGRGLAQRVKELALRQAIAGGAALDQLATFNAATNQPILAVNHRLGFEPVAELRVSEVLT